MILFFKHKDQLLFGFYFLCLASAMQLCRKLLLLGKQCLFEPGYISRSPAPSAAAIDRSPVY